MGQMGGGGPGYGQQQRTAPQMPAQSTYQMNAPYQGGFTPGAPGAQMMQAGQAVPFQMNGGFPAGNFRGVNGMMGGNQRQGNSWYGMNPSQMRPPPKRNPVSGNGAGDGIGNGTPAVTPPVTDPATGEAVVDPNLGMASDVYGHVVGDGTGSTTDGTTPDPITGAPRYKHSALAQQIAATHDLMAERRANTLGKGMGAVGGPGDPRYAAMQQQMRALWAQRKRGDFSGGGGPKNAPV
jgi:hypothetical protein